MYHIAPGFACLPVELDDAGDIFQCTKLAGSVAIQASKATTSDKSRIDISKNVVKSTNKELGDESPASSNFCRSPFLTKLFNRNRQRRQPCSSITTAGKYLTAIQPVGGLWV